LLDQQVLKKFNIKGFTYSDRFEAISFIEKATMDHGFWIMESHFFSNTSLNLHIEGITNDLESWLLDLQSGGLRYYEDYSRHFSPGKLQYKEDDPETCIILLRIDFIHGSSPLKRIVPSVPG
jgi:hypothetical protein